MRAVSIVIVLGMAAVARADAIQQADALFDEGQKLKAAGDKKGACAKFSDALKLNPNAIGVILNVGVCKEEAGKWASAMRLFMSAREIASEHNQEPERKAAEEHIAADEARVAHLAIAFAEMPGPQTKLVVDDDVVPVSSASDVPVDPGARTVAVSEPGRVSWQTTIVIAEHEHKAIAVPKLGLPVTVKKTPVGKILVFGGVGLEAVAIGVGLWARRNYNREFPIHCMEGTNPDKPQCSMEGAQKTHDAATLGNVGTGLAIAGGAAFAVGAVLWYLSPGETGEHQVSIAPAVGPDLTGVVAVGRL